MTPSAMAVVVITIVGAWADVPEDLKDRGRFYCRGEGVRARNWPITEDATKPPHILVTVPRLSVRSVITREQKGLVVASAVGASDLIDIHPVISKDCWASQGLFT